MSVENALIREGENLFRAMIKGYSLKFNFINKTVSCGKYTANLTEAGLKFIAYKLKTEMI